MLLMRALPHEGLRIPGDVAGMGADDLFIGRMLRPRQGTVQIGLPTGGPLATLWTGRCAREPSGITQRHDLTAAAAIHREST